MNISLSTFRRSLLCVITCLLSFFIMPATVSANPLFEQGNEALARGDAQTALDVYLKIANTEGTSPALAENIAAAAEIAKEPGLIEWAERTILLRNTEWAIIIATALSLIWAATIAIGVWKYWPLRKHTLTSIICATGIAACLWTVHHWMPPAHEAIIIRASPNEPSATEKSRTPSTTSNILLSPFSSAEMVGSLPLGAHVILTPVPSSSTQAPESYIYITHPDTNLTGWVHTDEVRLTGN